MTTLTLKMTLRIADAQSLKDKRQTAKRIIERVRNKYNVSIAQVDTQDDHKILTLGIAVVSQGYAHARDVLDTVERFIESLTDADILDIQIE